MIPYIEDNAEFKITQLPTATFKLNISKNTVSGIADKLQAMAQAIYLILNTERYEHLIYSWNYGVELSDLIGLQSSFVLPEIKRRITEALLQDTRITAVDNFEFERVKDKTHVTFTAYTIFGQIEADKEIAV